MIAMQGQKSHLEIKVSPEIREYNFDEEGCEEVRLDRLGSDWPVVYIISNDREAYIGETCSIHNRMKQHLSNPARQGLKRIDIVYDEQANKSATLDIEQSLIRLCGADDRFTLQNLNAGQSASHNYYQREMYKRLLPDIWQELLNHELANKRYEEIVNSDLFKYSPFTALTQEQSDISYEILDDIADCFSKGRNGVFVVRGSAGTGKTVLAMSLILSLANAGRSDIDSARDISEFTDEDLIVHDLASALKKNGPMKIGLVVPMTSLRMTLGKVFKNTPGLFQGMVIGPSDVTKKNYDILIVDESHRLARRQNLSSYGAFDNTSKLIGMNPKSMTQLDWVLKSCRYCVLFYDSDQTVKGSDITDAQFREAVGSHREAVLHTQLRCLGGGSYTDYVRRILSCTQDTREKMEDYDLRIFDDVGRMTDSIKTLDKAMGLCRNVAGYSWEWKTKGMSRKDAESKDIYDIEIEGYRYIWNMSNKEWILREGSVDEIGCIHTTQGYDLNYVGVIFGREIDYDPASNRITVDLKLLFDKKVKSGCDAEAVRRYVINSYRVMLTRGIRGCYVYACNENLAAYLRRFMDPDGSRR